MVWAAPMVEGTLVLKLCLGRKCWPLRIGACIPKLLVDLAGAWDAGLPLHAHVHVQIGREGEGIILEWEKKLRFCEVPPPSREELHWLRGRVKKMVGLHVNIFN